MTQDMPIPLDLTFRDMAPSDTVTTTVNRWLDRLDKLGQRIDHCSVVIERPHQSQRHGQGFHIRVELAVPDRVISVARDPARDEAHTNVHSAIADAFRAARRQLQEHAQIQRGEVKLHA